MLEKKPESDNGTGDVKETMKGLEKALREQVEIEKSQLEVDKKKVEEIQKNRKEAERRNTFLLHLSSTIENIDNLLRFSVVPGVEVLINYQKTLTDLLRVFCEGMIHRDIDKDKVKDLLSRIESMGTQVTINTGTNVNSGRDTNFQAGHNLDFGANTREGTMGINISSGGDTSIHAGGNITIQEVTKDCGPIPCSEKERVEEILKKINESVKSRDKTALQSAMEVLKSISGSVASSVASRLASEGLAYLLR